MTFLASLRHPYRAEAFAAIEKLTARGNTVREPLSKSLGNGLYELRTKSGVRIFYTFRPNRLILLLHGIVKKQSAIPAEALATARQRLAELTRKR